MRKERGGGGEEGKREIQNAWELDQRGTERKVSGIRGKRDDAL